MCGSTSFFTLSLYHFHSSTIYHFTSSDTLLL